MIAVPAIITESTKHLKTASDVSFQLFINKQT